MKPTRIFLLLLGIALFFFLTSVLLPDRELNITPGYKFRFPSMKSVFMPVAKEYADIASILQQKRTDADSLVRKEISDTTKKTDTVTAKLTTQPLEYPQGDRSVLYAFFRSLSESQMPGGAIHILHYGDSQLEGDRISDYLRTRFQTEFGGSGPGLLPIGEETYRLAMLCSVSGNWYSQNLMGTKYKDQGSHPYGPLGRYFRYSRGTTDTLDTNDPEAEGWVTYQGRGNYAERSSRYHRCRVFYENYQQPAKVRFFNGETLMSTDTLEPTSSLRSFELSLAETPSSLTIRFSGKGSPDFYGVCLDNSSGVFVDNIPSRGSSGLEFTRMNSSLLTTIYRMLNAKLLILQYGVNLVPGNIDDYGYYENALRVQLIHLRKLVPDVSIIVIGVSDASFKKGDSYESYPSVSKILKAQRSAALKANCVFWDLYEAMGGKNSMPSWVLAKEPLATTDFLHFNYSGARVVGKMFYSALINDYNEYIRSNP